MDALPKLADFETCEFTYPDGSPVPCGMELASLGMTFVAVEPQPPSHWGCLEQVRLPDRRGFDLMAPMAAVSPATGTSLGGIRFASGSPHTPVGGVVRLHEGGEPVLYSWLSGSSAGFVEVPAPFDVPADGLEALLYQPEIQNATPRELAEATVVPLWSLHDDKLWLTLLVATQDNRHAWFFQPPQPADSTQLFRIEGQDFAATFILNTSFSGGIGSASGRFATPC